MTDVEPPGASVTVISCGDCAALDKIDPLTLLASATQPCRCGCGWDEFVCQICGKAVGIRTTLGTIDLGDAPDGVVGDRYRHLFREDTQPPS